MRALARRSVLRSRALGRASTDGFLGLFYALGVGATLVGCESTVMLGAECDAQTRCTKGDQGDGDAVGGDGDRGHGGDAESDSPQGDSGLDMDGGNTHIGPGGSHDATTPDATVWLPVLDAGAGTPAPALRNPSFERVSGMGPGDLNFSAFRALDPWYVCLAPTQINFVRVEENVDGATPKDGRYFVGFSYMYVLDLTVPIAQQLASPLKAGQRYAFLVDVRSQSGVDQQLGLIVRGGTDLTPCAFLTNLAETDYLPDNQWTTHCITFTPDTDLTQIAFMPKNKNTVAVFNRFYIDNIRTDPSCQ